MSKKDRRRVLAQIWGTPTSHEIDMVDEGDQIVVFSNYRGVVGWWMEIFKTFYPNIKCKEKGDTIKIKPTMGVTIKLNKTTRLMKVYGKDHWPWFVDTFEILLDIGNGDAVELPSEGGSISENSVTRYLQLNKDDEEVQDLLDRIPEGGGIMHHEFIMRLWKSLLDDWFGVGAAVYIVTPRIDSERLFQVMLLMIRNKGTGFKVTLMTPAKQMDGERFDKIMERTRRRIKEVQGQHGARLVSDVKLEWVMLSLNVQHSEFSTNFIAAHKDEEGEVLTTTAHFHKSHFHHQQKDNVSYCRLSPHDLRKNYLLPLNIGNNVF
ncbi:hypothetical protein RRG08_038151 [Elysia crispata]|uniref:Uncharacterized protein n=1 Tax=Elysia crispata TaxID=231223 RepID=A0AAE0YTV6_9GAST|nr:hypothetical protein RRG08_038151 [Elysia crispata]